MREAAVLALVRRYTDAQFPKTCTLCQRVFSSFADYLRVVTPIGAPVSYDAMAKDWSPSTPRGMVAMSNCACGTTLSVTSRGMPATEIARVLVWARGRAKREGVSLPQLFMRLRARLKAETLADADKAAAPPK